ncbi:uncharacterized protein [Halyomorpha halys]|uniref:uncharacterized protein isoform X2 n=1 Tax=Halyomorpha halys TaxID=286706 RepID=UPI0006D5040A|nr:uncharacterized protein LOC106691871 isoform X2 [Halyomorpha halys]
MLPGTFEELLLLLYLLLALIVDFLHWLKTSLLDISTGEPYSKGGETESKEAPLIEDIYRDRPPSVTVRGVGLIAAYSGRRAMFAVSPALRDGLEVSSEGPANIHFQYKLKDSMLLVGYIAPRPGRYYLRVSRFGRSAPGSPFVLTVEEAPPGYRGNFGAALWNDIPVKPPILSGIVDFITEKMYLDENGQLFKLNKDGTISQDRYIIKRRNSDDRENTSVELPEKTDKQTDTSDNFPSISPEKARPKNITDSNTTESFMNASLERILIKDNTSLDPYQRLSNNLSKELNTDLKLLNMLGTDCEDSRINLDTRCNVSVPRITISEYGATEEPLTEHNHSREDQFLSQLESRYSARRSRKLERAARNDAVSNEPYDGRGQIGAPGQSRAAFLTAHDDTVCFVSQSAKGYKEWRKYHPSNLAFTLGLSKYHRNLTGIRLLHDIYRAEESPEEKENNRNHRRKGVFNNNKMARKYSSNTNITTADRELDINNLDIENINPKAYNSKQLPTSLSDPNFQTRKNKSKTNLSRKKHRETNKISGSFRTLSLPDFNRILSLSVRGLRKAKSCGDKSFRALSSNALSTSLKSLFERDQVYHVDKKSRSDKMKSVNDAATLVRIAHYGSGKETKLIETGSKSVDEWKKYWEGGAYKKDTGVIKGCHVEVKGIVTKGKELFETHREEIYIENNLSQNSSRHSSPRISSDKDNETREENKTAFQKAKEMFEGNYTSLKAFQDPRYRRKRSVSERFHISSLSKDIYSGVTPNHLGIPNRIPAVASLGSVYCYSPVYPRLSRTPSPENTSHWNDLLFSDPSYV